MSNAIKKLAGETVIYGVTTIVGRFVNWLLVPLYSAVFLPEEYGVVTNLMSYTAIFMVVLTYGTETGFFRFCSSDNKNDVFSTLITSLSATTAVFLLLIFSFLSPISDFLDIPTHKEYLILLSITIAIDVITSIPFALLRQENRPMKFGIIKLTNIAVNIGSNLFFLILCPYLLNKGINLPFYNPDGGIVYVFVSYLIAASVTFLMMLPYVLKFQFHFSYYLLRKILKYSFPILIVSIAGMINLNIDKIIMPKLLSENMSIDKALSMTGIYGANYKLALIMYIFTQGFRFAFEPFFFSYSKNEDSKEVYKKVFLYFTGFGLIIFLGCMCWIDVLQHFLRRPEYNVGAIIVPWVLMANLFQGMYYSLSLWYKLTDKTYYGAYMALIGCMVTISINFIFMPLLGYIASAYAVFACFLIMCILSLILGKKHYKINYNISKILFYFILAVSLYFISRYIKFDSNWTTSVARTPLVIIFAAIFIFNEMKFVFTKKFLNTMLRKK
ncbi:MAG: oligosaccharide flippase family protein [Culturomica sp.]|jgi:O-antigen/teichoic acid export membrane protein|nr:oligosaccharide flippase family protein [Culturomica sp.]